MPPKSKPKAPNVKSAGKPPGSKKRKTGPIADQYSHKAPRLNEHSALSATQTIKFLLSATAKELCQPQDEKDSLRELGEDAMTFSSDNLSPFNELMCALILSRPISHKLGLRSIRTLLNSPYNFRTPQAIREAGIEHIHKALWDAKTQHKGKTAEQIIALADVVIEKFAKGNNDSSLEKCRSKAGENIDTMRELLIDNIKGVGQTGMDIFCRRIQGRWEEVFPFVDARTLLSMEKLGLPNDAEDLLELCDECWGDVHAHVDRGSTDEEKKRHAFATVLERAIGLDLENKVEEALKQAKSF